MVSLIINYVGIKSNWKIKLHNSIFWNCYFFNKLIMTNFLNLNSGKTINLKAVQAISCTDTECTMTLINGKQEQHKFGTTEYYNLRSFTRKDKTKEKKTINVYTKKEEKECDNGD